VPINAAMGAPDEVLYRCSLPEETARPVRRSGPKRRGEGDPVKRSG